MAMYDDPDLEAETFEALVAAEDPDAMIVQASEQ